MGGDDNEAAHPLSLGTLRKLRRERELTQCGRYFLEIARDTEPTREEQHSRDTCAWTDYTDHGIRPSPSQALRMPRMVPQPKPWVAEVVKAARDGKR